MTNENQRPIENSRRFRGIMGIAATWGVALSALATSTLAVGLATGLVPTEFYGARELVAVAIRGLAAGALAGGVFGFLLSTRERGQSLNTLSTRRVALWGFIAAASVPAMIVLAASGPVLPFGVLAAGMLGAGVGGGILTSAFLRIARRAPDRLPRSEISDKHLLP